MLNLFSNASLNQLASSGTMEAGLPVVSVDGSVINASSGDFTELLNAETSLVEMLEELKTLLSAEDFLQLESMLAEGQALPLPEIIAALRQQLSASEIEQLPSQIGKLSDAMPDQMVITEAGAVSITAEGQVVDPSAAVEAIELNTTEQAVAPFTTGQTVVPIAIGQMTIPVSVAVDQAVAMQMTNGKASQPVATGQVAISTNIAGDTAGLSSSLGDSSADPDQQAPTGQFRMTEALAAAQVVQKTPDNALFRTTEAGLAAVNNAPVAPGLAKLNISQPTVQNQANVLPIHIPMGEKGWDQSMGERILWMVGRQVQGAEVRITPPQLGPIDIRISIQNDQANVTFAAQHGVVREALEASIPRLREMLSENNLQLVNVDVNQRNGEQRASAHLFNQSSSGGEQGNEEYEFDEDETAASHVLTIQSDGLVDDFA